MLKDINQKIEIITALTAFSKNPQGFLLFSGANGTGKSFAAMAVYEVVSPFDLPFYDYDVARFLTQADLNILWSEFNTKHKETNTFLKDLYGSKLLILDDVGTRTPTEAYMDFLYAVVDKRYTLRSSRGTIITTNLNSTDMRQKFGDAFVSRVASGKCFKFEGLDRRFKAFEF